MSIRQFVFDRLSDGKKIEEIWREMGSYRWNYINALRREWEKMQRNLKSAMERKP